MVVAMVVHEPPDWLEPVVLPDLLDKLKLVVGVVVHSVLMVDKIRKK